MKFKDWKFWFKGLPWTLKWFAILVLIRPMADNLYFLKNISPLLSPLYIFGVLTPLLAIVAMVKRKKPNNSKIDRVFKAWMFFLLLGTAFVIFYDPLSLNSLEYLLKLTLPVYIYFFARRFIRSEKDLHGLLQTFLYSGIFVVAIFLYEVLINPIAVEESRGFSRIQGSFGDVVNYATYIVFSFIIMAYFFLRNRGKIKYSKRLRNIAFIFGLCLLGMINIHHVATYIVFSSVLLLFLVFNFKTNKGAAFVIAAALTGLFALFGADAIDENISPLIEKDIEVYEGKGESSQLLHGRVGRWEKMWEMYSNENILAQFFGYPLSLNYAYHVVGIGSHNDFIRIMFLSGFVGLYFYLLLLFVFFLQTRRLLVPEKYLALATLAALVLYSVSIVPTYYPPFMYITMCVIAYVALPKQLQ